jgi:hypothetical protein
MGATTSKKRTRELESHESFTRDQAFKLMDRILERLNSTIRTFQETSGNECKIIKKIQMNLIEMMDILTEMKNEEVLQEVLLTLSELRDNLFVRLGKICCKNPGQAGKCAREVSLLVEVIKEFTKYFHKPLNYSKKSFAELYPGLVDFTREPWELKGPVPASLL